MNKKLSEWFESASFASVKIAYGYGNMRIFYKKNVGIAKFLRKELEKGSWETFSYIAKINKQLHRIN